jgi:hypothetical protein
MDVAAVVHNMEDTSISPFVILFHAAVRRRSTKPFPQELLVLEGGCGVPEIAITSEFAMKTLGKIDGPAEAAAKPQSAPTLGRRPRLQIAHRVLPLIRRSLPGGEE